MGIQLIQGDITEAKVDAIVNAANEQMLGGGGVDGAIHQAAGPALRTACETAEAIDGVRCPTGEARITLAGKLHARYVIHAVGPIYDMHPNPQKLLTQAYRHSYQLALDYDCSSLAVPAISCGIYGYPLREAAQIALGVSTEKKYRDLDIAFYLFSQAIYDEWDAVLKTL